jgi:hypothetical protein
MRRLVAPLVLATALLGLAAAGPLAGSLAQEATPEAAETGLPEGITAEAVSFAPVAAFPPTPASVDLIRVRVEPGAGVFFPETDPGLGLHLVESGALTLRRFSAAVVVRRAGGGEEVLPAGAETRLGAGDTFVFPPFVAGEWRNDGAEPAAFTVVLVVPAGAAAPPAP